MLLVRSLLRTGQPAEARQILETCPGLRLRPRIVLAPEPLLPPGEDVGAGCRGPRTSRVLPRGVADRARAGPLRRCGQCGSCHPSIYRRCSPAGTPRPSRGLAIPKPLSLPDRHFPDPADPKVSHAFQSCGGRHPRRDSGRRQVYRAVARYAFGSPDHYVTLVGPDDQGRTRMLRISSYHSPKGSGLDLSPALESHPSDPTGFLGNALIPGDGVRRCLACHVTNLHSIESQSGPESADHAIGCEACHGPGGNHVLSREADFDDPAIVAPEKASSRMINGVCERCHGSAHVETVTGDGGRSRLASIPIDTMYRSRCYTEGSKTFIASPATTRTRTPRPRRPSTKPNA